MKYTARATIYNKESFMRKPLLAGVSLFAVARASKTHVFQHQLKDMPLDNVQQTCPETVTYAPNLESYLLRMQYEDQLGNSFSTRFDRIAPLLNPDELVHFNSFARDWLTGNIMNALFFQVTNHTPSMSIHYINLA